MNAIDTNIWIYSHDRRDAGKRENAKRVIVEARPWALLWQVGCEFIAAARKLAPFGFDEGQAWQALAAMNAAADRVLLPVPELWPDTRALQARFSLCFWDALLIAACIRGGVRTLYSENFGSPRQIDGLSILNPFMSS